MPVNRTIVWTKYIRTLIWIERHQRLMNRTRLYAKGRWVLSVVIVCAVLAIGLGYYWYSYYAH